MKDSTDLDRWQALVSPDPIPKPTRATLRWLAVMLLVAAGILHLAQVGVHLAEAWHVAGFFVLVGIGQIALGLWLLPPRRPAWPWVGIIGSAAVIVVWVVSRTSGLPFVESGKPEPLGIADAFASLIEALTITTLGLHLVARRRSLPAGIRALAATATLTLAVAWQVAAGAGMFNADDARLALDEPQLIDWLVLALGVSVAATFLLAWQLATGPALAGLRRGLLVVSGLLATGGVVLTLPPTIGQNVECAYAPLSTITGVRHDEEPLVVDIPPGETRLITAFELRVCGPGRVELLDAKPLTTTDNLSQIVSFWLVPPGSAGGGAALQSPPPDAVRVPPGGVVNSGQRLAVELQGVAGTTLELGSLRLTYRTDDGVGSFAFATSIDVCSGSACSGGEK